MKDLSTVIDEIQKAVPQLELRKNEPMSAHCSFKIGGPAAALLLPGGTEELQAALKILKNAGISPLIIGNGTDLLITDEPLERIVIKMSQGISAVQRLGETGISAGSGISLARLASVCAEFSLTGLEFAHGIPGTLGGAAAMNAGAYGGEMKDVLRSVSYLDENGEIRSKRGDELELSYRHSAFSNTPAIILSCELELAAGKREEISAKMRELSEKRRASQPLDKPSAGSTFKRPAEGYAAALIDKAGLRGFAIGGAQVSEKHAGFVINRGNASFSDVKMLMEHIRQTVLAATGVELEPEVKIIENV